jgi:dihydroxy-acid dehydratase
VEESIRANPIDGVVLLMGCDKTTPALLMGAASCDLPTLGVSGGPMLSGRFRGQKLGSGTGVWQMSEDVRAGRMPLCDFLAAESGMSRSKGHCMTMGTASTMAAMVEALGLGLPGNATIPAVDAGRNRLAQLAGRRIVAMVAENLCMSAILTRRAFENAIRVNAAIGGSTNAVLHLLAIARRIGVELTLDDFDALGSEMPCLVNLQPIGKHLMEDFHAAGGLPAVLAELLRAGLLHGDALSVTGASLADNVAEARCWDRDVITSLAEPVMKHAGIAVLRGNLAPRGAVIKPGAASPHLLQHSGHAVVFDNIEDFRRRIEDEALEVDENSVLVLRNCGPRGYPGMPEVGNMALPPKLLRRGVTDMVRISDARMSGTAYGTVVLHVAPEAAAGGALAAVRDGDMVTIDVPGRRIELEISNDELATRLAQWLPPPKPARGWERLYVDQVNQADEGADLALLVGGSGADVPRESH